AGADVVVITTDHTGIDYRWVVEQSRLVVDTRNATAGLSAPHILGLSGTSRAVTAVMAEPAPLGAPAT
ncbi:MAG TPA: hypothetical protein VF188_01415, partial [Longimicrobiales bacterium]